MIVKPVSFRPNFSDSAVLNRLTGKLGIRGTSLIRLALRELARAQGVWSPLEQAAADAADAAARAAVAADTAADRAAVAQAAAAKLEAASPPSGGDAA